MLRCLQPRPIARTASRSAIDTAEQAISIDQSRLPPLPEGINARQVRSDGLLSLMKGGSSDRATVLQAQAELVNAWRTSGPKSLPRSPPTRIASPMPVSMLRNSPATPGPNPEAESDRPATRNRYALSPEISADAGVMRIASTIRALDGRRPALRDRARLGRSFRRNHHTAESRRRGARVMSMHPTAVGNTTDLRCRGYVASRPGD